MWKIGFGRDYGPVVRDYVPVVRRRGISFLHAK